MTSVGSQLALGTPSLPPQARIMGGLPSLPSENLHSLLELAEQGP